MNFHIIFANGRQIRIVEATRTIVSDGALVIVLQGQDLTFNLNFVAAVVPASDDDEMLNQVMGTLFPTDLTSN